MPCAGRLRGQAHGAKLNVLYLQSMAGMAAQHAQEVQQLRGSLAEAQQQSRPTSTCVEVRSSMWKHDSPTTHACVMQQGILVKEVGTG